MISESQNNALKLLMEVFDKENDYKNYLINREKGLRKESFKHLDIFIKDFETRSKQEQMHFIRTLFELENIRDVIYAGIPQPLMKVLSQKLEKYCENGTADEKIFFWAGKYLHRMDYLEKSLEINPNYDPARSHIISVKSYRLWLATHHLPDYYCQDGAEQEDFKLCENVENEIKKLSSEEEKKYFFDDLYFYKELIENYIEWKKSGISSSFEEWGKENNKKVDSGVVAIYYDE